MEACATAHYWGRLAQDAGHTVVLLPAAYVRPYVRRNKTDRTDAEALLEAGASKVYACASHPVLSGKAVEKLTTSHIEQVIVTNTIPLTEAAKNEPKIKVLSIAGLLATAIKSIHEETSVSSLFS